MSKNKAPVELPNDAEVNPYAKTSLGKKPGGRLISRDPRFSDLSGKLDLDMFKKSYGFLNDMRKAEFLKIKEAVKIYERFGPTSTKGTEALDELSHFNITNIDEAKRALNKYETERLQLEQMNELKTLKKELIEKEKAKIISTGKKPYFYADKKIKKLYKEIQNEKIKEALSSNSINTSSVRTIHKKLASKSRRKLPKERKYNYIPKARDN